MEGMDLFARRPVPDQPISSSSRFGGRGDNRVPSRSEVGARQWRVYERVQSHRYNGANGSLAQQGGDSLYETITRRNRKPMIQPKDLYRKLAMLLAEIDEGRDKEDYLLSVLARLDNSFTRDLHLTDGRLYAEEHEQFLPMYAADGREPVHLDEDRRALDSEAAPLVL